MFFLCLPVCGQSTQDSWNRLIETLAERQLTYHEAEPRLDRLGQKLAQLRFSQEDIEWSFAVVETSQIDAGCCGRGVVYVTAGLLQLDFDDDELIGVLGHEVAHGILGHIESNLAYQEEGRLLQEQRQEALQTSRQVQADREAQQLHQETLQLKERYDAWQRKRPSFQEQERDADAVGLQLARLAGHREDGLIRALRKI